MRNKIAPVKNVIGLEALHTALLDRGLGIPGMGLVYGFAGVGKTTSVSYLCAKVNGVYVRAKSLWTPTSMLGDVMRELGADPMKQSAPMLDFIVQMLATSGRTLIVDDINQILENAEGRQANRMLEALRDIHDLSISPVLLIGHQGTERLIQRPQIRRRLSEVLEFRPLDEEDARRLADTVCEVKVADDLLYDLHDKMRGNAGFMIVGLARIERLGRANGLDTVTLAQWGDREYGIGMGRVA